jgi:hypothetical protein
LELVKKYAGKCWDKIACELKVESLFDVASLSLQTGRTPVQCLQAYQRSYNPEILKREFTPEEDELLRSLVETHGKNWGRGNVSDLGILIL